LRKIVAFVFSVSLVLTLGYAIIHPSFILIADWLGPLLGSSLLSALSAIYLIMGNPLSHASLIALWGGIAFFAGCIIRRRIGAILITLLTFFLLILILGANVYDIATTIQTMGENIGPNPMDTLPPLPEGLTFTLLFKAPVVGEVMEKTIGAMQGGGPPDPWIIASGILTTLALSVGIKLVAMVVGALAGVEVGKRLEPTFKPMSDSIRKGFGGKQKEANTSILKATVGLLTLIIIVSAAPALPSINATDEEFYSEEIFGFADSKGRAYIGNIFMGTGTPPVSLDTGTTGEVLAGLVISQKGIKDVISGFIGSEEGFESIFNILPETLMVAAYLDVPPELASTHSEGMAAAFADAYQVDLTQMMSFNPPIPLGEMEDLPQVTLVIYQSGATIEDLASTYLDKFSDKGGLIETVREATANGIILPQTDTDSSDGGTIFSGFMNVEALIRYLPHEILANITEVVPLEQINFLEISGGVSYWEHGVEAIGEGKGLDLLSLMGTESPPSFSEESDLSMVVVTTSNTTDLGEEVPNIKITTSLQEGDPMLEAIYTFIGLDKIDQKLPGANLESSTFEIGITGVVLPLQVEVAKEVPQDQYTSEDVIDVTVTVRNLDTATMTDIVLDDSSTLSRYPAKTYIITGSTTAQWEEIEAGGSRSISYQIDVGSGGIYSLAPARVEYLHEIKSFTKSSRWLEIRVRQPSPVSLGLDSLINTGRTFTEILDNITDGNGGTIFTASISITVLLIVALEIRNIMKWLSGG
jgi:hypothetical protein